ncbi:neuritin-like protein [Anolis carolinensis]|uniref:Neuritin 1 like n=1 Tax=Anolis carolinensis TaxID=28377 RepID=A0A803T422_ANOCA|nr:PREDICTED: neuritin-like protein [Anolis carolinensis]|eukprot:XP_008115872.1 PREDICTED: neuritin-like protein [Anolis carolinensis]
MGCRALLGSVALLLPLHLVFSEEPVTPASQKCNTIYKGFAECLIRLGDSMAQSVQQQQGQDSNQEQQELDTICKSWDDFHTCATQVLSSCPEEAANIWESLRQDSRKTQFQGNLHDLCSSRTQLAGNGRASDMDETNKETLRGAAPLPQSSLVGALTLVALTALVSCA